MQTQKDGEHAIKALHGKNVNDQDMVVKKAKKI
jgi:hypothetical protein